MKKTIEGVERERQLTYSKGGLQILNSTIDGVNLKQYNRGCQFIKMTIEGVNLLIVQQRVLVYEQYNRGCQFINSTIEDVSL